MTSMTMAGGQRQLAIEAFYAGPKYLAIGAAISATGIALHWADSAVFLVLLLIALVPVSAVTGAALGLLLFPVAQWIVGALRVPVAHWAKVHPLLLGMLGYIAVLPFAAWVAGDLGKAMAGAKGTNAVLVPAAVGGLIAGRMFGLAMQRYAEKLRRDSSGQDATP